MVLCIRFLLRTVKVHYVGQTKRSLAVCLKEHKRAVFNGDKETSALAEHVLSTGHDIDWANASIVASCDHLSQRLYLESWYIQKQPFSLNREVGPLPSIYGPLIRQ